MLNTLLFVLFLTFPITSFADANPTEPSKDSQQAEKPAAEIKSNYFNIALGYALPPDYGSTINGQISTLKASDPNFKRGAVAFDLGAYWPKEIKGLLWGISLYGVSDNLEASGYKVQTIQLTLGFSIIRYFGENIGEGLFLRADIGPARYSIDTTAPTGAKVLSSHSNIGYGYQVGGGYSIPIGSVHAGAGIFYSGVSVGSDHGNNFSLQISCLL